MILTATVSAFAATEVTVTKRWNDSLDGEDAESRSAPTVNIEGETSYEQLLNLFYPVGTYYCSNDESFDPNTAWGGTWTKLEDGRVLQATDDSSKVGTKVEAGLPNIQGYITIHSSEGGTNIYTVSGAFSGSTLISNQYVASYSLQTTGSSSVQNLKLDASLSSSIYGNSDTVQPPAVLCYIWLRQS